MRIVECGNVEIRSYKQYHTTSHIVCIGQYIGHYAIIFYNSIIKNARSMGGFGLWISGLCSSRLALVQVTFTKLTSYKPHTLPKKQLPLTYGLDLILLLSTLLCLTQTVPTVTTTSHMVRCSGFDQMFQRRSLEQ